MAGFYRATKTLTADPGASSRVEFGRSRARRVLAQQVGVGVQQTAYFGSTLRARLLPDRACDRAEWVLMGFR